MFTIDGTPTVERFELCLVSMKSPTATLRVPLVDHWLEIQLALRRVPDAAEGRHFFASLEMLVGKARDLLPAMQYYFLHKPPGLKLRFRVGEPDGELLDAILSEVLGWRFDWIEGVGLGSVFDQEELLPATYRDAAEALLTLSADRLLASARERMCCSEADWAAFAVDLLCRIGLDRWLVYEALSRLGRLRAVPLKAALAPETPLFDPRPMLAGPLPDFPAGFEASVSLLQVLNLLFNIWAVDAGRQTRILEAARDSTRPSLLAEAR
jgi:hypothetical protein